MIKDIQLNTYSDANTIKNIQIDDHRNKITNMFLIGILLVANLLIYILYKEDKDFQEKKEKL
jgi:uncharacterized membrane protein